MRNVGANKGRNPPRSPSFEWMGEQTGDADRTRERIMEQVNRDLRELDESIPGDIRDEVSVVSRGPYVELRINHKQDITPNRYTVSLQTGKGSLWQSRNSLADDEHMYFQTDALANVVFRVVPFRREPAQGQGEENPVIVTEPQYPPAPPTITKNAGASNNKKPFKN